LVDKEPIAFDEANRGAFFSHVQTAIDLLKEKAKQTDDKLKRLQKEFDSDGKRQAAALAEKDATIDALKKKNEEYEVPPLPAGLHAKFKTKLLEIHEDLEAIGNKMRGFVLNQKKHREALREDPVLQGDFITVFDKMHNLVIMLRKEWDDEFNTAES
jgi:Na+/phosphate symporter